MNEKDRLFIIGVALMIGGCIILMLSFMITLYFNAIFESVPLIRKTQELSIAQSMKYVFIIIGGLLSILGGVLMRNKK